MNRKGPAFQLGLCFHKPRNQYSPQFPFLLRTFAAMQHKNYDTDQILANLNIETLNEMQLASIAGNEQHLDVVLLSATGSGKTLAFLLPLLSKLDPADKLSQAMIVVPSQ